MPRHREPQSPVVVHRTARAGSAADPGAAAAAGGVTGLGRGCVGVRPRSERVAAGPPGCSAGVVSGVVPGAGCGGAGVLRGTGQRRGPVGAAPLLRRLVRRRRPPQERRRLGAVPAAATADDAGALVSRHLRPGGAAAADPGGPGLRAVTGAPGPGPAVPAGPGPVGDAAVRRRAAVGRCDGRGPGHGLPAGRGTGSVAGWPGWTWASSTPTRSPGRAGRRCWSPGGRSAPSTTCTCRTPKPRRRAVARRAPKPGQRGSRRWRHHRRRQRLVEARHARRVRQAQHEAAAAAVGWAVARRIGTLAVGDPRGVLNLPAGRRHNRRTRDWRVGRLISVLRDKAGQAGITLTLTDERGTSSTCPACRARVPKPRGRVFSCPRCGLTGHRDLIAAANIAARAGGGLTPAIPRPASRTAAPGPTFRVCPRRDVTRAAALITAPPAGPLAGTCPPRRLQSAGESLAPPRGPRKTRGTYEEVH